MFDALWNTDTVCAGRLGIGVVPAWNGTMRKDGIRGSQPSRLRPAAREPIEGQSRRSERRSRPRRLRWPLQGIRSQLNRVNNHLGQRRVHTEERTTRRVPPLARYSAFGTANARLRIGRGVKGVMLRMRPSGIDTMSYIESK